MAFDSTEWAWRDITVFLNGARVGKVSKITSKTSRETEHLHGVGDEPFDINPGNKTYSGEVELQGTVIANMNRAAIAVGGDDLTDIPWQIEVSFKRTATEPMHTVSVPNVRFDEFEIGGANNEKSFKKTLPYKSLKPIYK